MCVQIALYATTVPALGCERTIALPAFVAATQPPTGISVSAFSAPGGALGELDAVGLAGVDDAGCE
jgi:hypothetical protein